MEIETVLHRALFGATENSSEGSSSQSETPSSADLKRLLERCWCWWQDHDRICVAMYWINCFRITQRTDKEVYSQLIHMPRAAFIMAECQIWSNIKLVLPFSRAAFQSDPKLLPTYGKKHFTDMVWQTTRPTESCITWDSWMCGFSECPNYRCIYIESKDPCNCWGRLLSFQRPLLSFYART